MGSHASTTAATAREADMLNIGILGGPRWVSCPLCGVMDAGRDDHQWCGHQLPREQPAGAAAEPSQPDVVAQQQMGPS
jgi:hypothetical protein